MERGTETIVLLDKAEIIVEAGLNMQKNVRKNIRRTQRKAKFCVKKKSLLLIVGIVWMIAGVMFTRNYFLYNQLVEEEQN